MNKRNRSIWIAGVLVVFALFYVLTEKDLRNSLADPKSDSNVPTTPREQRRASNPEQTAKAVDAILSNLASDEIRILDEIIAQDDLCGYEAYIQNKIGKGEDQSRVRDEIQKIYFSTTPLKNDFEHLERALEGKPVGGSHYVRFMSALGQAGWLESSPSKRGDKSQELSKMSIAIHQLLGLAKEDAGNAAPAAFALALIHSHPNETELRYKIEDEAARELLESATRFDSYQIDHARAVADFEDPSAVSYFIRVDYISTMSVPKWSSFKSGLTRATEQQSDLRLRVADLMIANSKNARQPSYAFGYSILENVIAQKLASHQRSYPDSKEIDAAFTPQNLELRDSVLKNVEHIFQDDGTCDPKRIQKVREDLRILRRGYGGLGFAL